MERKTRFNRWYDQFPDLDTVTYTDLISRLVYFHTIEEEREIISEDEIAQLIKFINIEVPRDLGKILWNLCTKGKRLIRHPGNYYTLRREIRKSIEQELERITGSHPPPRIAPVPAFEFPGRVFTDKKVGALLGEAKRCYSVECWNACGILMRIVLERTLDSADTRVKTTSGLKAKLNVGISTAGIFSKTIVDTLQELRSAKLVGDIVAHHSGIVLDQADVDLVVPSLRMLIKEVTTV